MRVKIGDTWYDADETPICIEFEDVERDVIISWDKEEFPRNKIAFYNEDDHSGDKIIRWMLDD